MNAIHELKEARKNSNTSYGVTFVLHALLFIWLWFSVLHTPDPPFGDGGGMELSMALGEEDMGGPSEVPAEEPTPVQPTPETPQEEQQVITQDAEETDITAKKPEEKKTEIKKPVDKPKPVVTTPVEKPRVADQRSLFKKPTNSTNSGGHGDGEVPGNQGNPNGVPGGDPNGNGIGDGRGGTTSGTGTSDGPGSGSGPAGFDHTLKGRSLTRRPVIKENSRETGKVVVGITVDWTGKVIKVQPGLKGTTTLDPGLIETARQGAWDAHFSPKADGSEEQYGTMTFVFRVKK